MKCDVYFFPLSNAWGWTGLFKQMNRGKNVSRFRTDVALYGKRWIMVGLKAWRAGDRAALCNQVKEEGKKREGAQACLWFGILVNTQERRCLRTAVMLWKHFWGSVSLFLGRGSTMSQKSFWESEGGLWGEVGWGGMEFVGGFGGTTLKKSTWKRQATLQAF